MQISELRDHVRTSLLAFAWDQWGQLGVSAATGQRRRWAADPEALLLFTFEIGQDDARLFDEVLDWLVVNERLISVQRLRNLCRDDMDRELAEAALDWVGRWRPRARLTASRREDRPAPSRMRLFFRRSRVRPTRPDPAFVAHGWLKPDTEPSHKSQPPDLFAPINFAFRLRHILGVGARAEVVRVLLTTGAPRVSAQAITESAAYSKRNVHEALTSLYTAGVIDALTLGNERRYGIERERWASLLGLAVEELPLRRDWPQLLYAMRLLTRWLEDEHHHGLSEYMLASEARVLAEQLGPELWFAGVPFSTAGRAGADYWQDFVGQAKGAVDALA
ncbi:MAG: hypothetical protein ACYDA6_08705 [Solirubrobacteraceae bacterium]